jgi:DNA-binding NtrC family response regulator
MNQFAKYYALPPRAFSPALLEACQRYLWPGNLKELQSFVKRYLVMGSEHSSLGELERGADFPLQYVHPPQKMEPSSGTSIPTGPQERGASLKSLAQSAKGEAERNAIATVLDETHWNRKAAAQVLQISYRTLLYKIEQYRMSPPPNQFPSNGNGGGLKGNRQGT